MLLRQLKLSGDYADTDWTNPANPAPDNARRFKVTSKKIVFEIEGRVGTDAQAAEQDVGGLEVDAWVGYEAGLRDPSDPSLGHVIRRGLSVVEAMNSPLPGRVRLLASDTQVGGTGRLNLNLTSVGGLAAIHVRIVSGARPL